MANGVTIAASLVRNHDSSDSLEKIYYMFSELQRIHKKGYYAENINFNTISFEENDGVTKIDFNNLNSTSNTEEFRIHCLENIRDLSFTALGMFMCCYSAEFQPTNPAMFDYSRISKQDPYYIYNNYNFISEAIPFGRDYFDDIMTGNYYYYNNYVDKTRKESQGLNSNRGSYVKTTPFGKGYQEDDNGLNKVFFQDAAYSKAWFFLTMAGCGSILAFVIYIIYKCL